MNRAYAPAAPQEILTETLGVPAQETLQPALENPGITNRLKKAAATGLSGLALFGAAEASANSYEAVSNPANLPDTVTASFKTETSYANVKVSDVAKANVTILSNVSAKPLPKRLVRRLERKGACKTFDGKETTIYTYGLGEDGGTYGRDNRKSRFCKINGQWIRVKCRNPAVINEVPEDRVRLGRVLFVKSFANAKITLKAESVASVRCAEGGATAEGYGRAVATSTARLRNFVRTKGAAAVRIYGKAHGEAYTEAQASAKCEQTDSQTTFTGDNPPPPPPPPPPTPQNRPPRGEMAPPQHLYSQGLGKICVDSISDPDGDPVSAFNFRVYRADDPALSDGNPATEPAGVGTFTSGVYEQAGGAQCRGYQAPYTTQNYKVVASASVTDGKNNVALAGKQFDILADNFGR